MTNNVNTVRKADALIKLRVFAGVFAPIMGFYNWSMFCCALLCVYSSFAIISIGMRELLALLCLSPWSVALPHDATGLSAVCDCGIS